MVISLFYRLVLLLGALAFLPACGTVNSALRSNTRDEFAKGNLAQAEQVVLNPKNIADEKNKLLNAFDLGLIAHYSGDFEKSNHFLFQAKQIARELYTASTIEDAASLLWNDNAKSYPGMEYEVSLAHYYATLNFIFLSQAEKIPAWSIPEVKEDDRVVMAGEAHEGRELSNRDRAKFRGQARSELLAWNAFLNQVRQRNRGEPYYKDDLLNKAFASYVHATMDTSQDRNISRVLLQDADSLLVRAYSAYPSFNKKWEAYVDNYKKFEGLGEASVKQQFIEPTENYLTTQKEISAEKKGGNVYFLVESREVSEKKEKNYVIGLSTVMNNVSDPALRRSIEEIGARVFLEMAPQFGLAFVAATVVGGSSKDNPTQLSEAIDSAVGFSFKLPQMESAPLDQELVLKLTSESGLETHVPLALLNPLNDIARLNVNRRAEALALKTGLRVGVKYLAALVPAILTYKRMEKVPDFLRWAAATGVWMAGKKVVDASERADLRSWLLLPQWIAGAELSLPKGKYTVFLEEKPAGRTTNLGSMEVDAARTVHRARIFSGGFVRLD